MKGKLVRGRWIGMGLAVVFLGLACYAWVERQPLQAWYHAFRVVRLADAGARAPHLATLAHFKPSAGWRALARYLDSPNEARRLRAAESMAELLTHHVAHGEARAVGRAMAEEQTQRSPAGQAATLRCLRPLLLASEGEDVDAWVKVAATALANSRGESAECLHQALEIALALARRADPVDEEWLGPWAKLAERALTDQPGDAAEAGIRLAMTTGSNALTAVRPYVHDGRKGIRALALAALGGREDLLPTDELLPLLHDVDAEVRGLCEQSLRSRGLSSNHLALARDMTHPQAAIRARVAGQVFEHGELDARLWLERLSRDRSPAVRASVARAAAGDPDGRLTVRLHQMTLEDPSATVRQIAEYYLSRRQRREESQ